MDGQMSFIGGTITEEVYKKPRIGAELVFIYKGHEYLCEVTAHCGYDFFYVKFTGITPRAFDQDLGEVEGWHLSMRGYGDDWRYSEV